MEIGAKKYVIWQNNMVLNQKEWFVNLVSKSTNYKKWNQRPHQFESIWIINSNSGKMQQNRRYIPTDIHKTYHSTDMAEGDIDNRVSRGLGLSYVFH